MRGVCCFNLCASCFKGAETIVTEDFYVALNLGRPFVTEGLMDRIPFEVYRDRMISIAWSSFQRCMLLLRSINALNSCECGNSANLIFSFCHGDWLCMDYGENHGENRLDLFMPEILKSRNHVYWAHSERLSFDNN